MKFLTTHLENHILTISINRPKKLNALNRSVIGELSDLFKQARGNEDVKAILITGTGESAFAAGADISEFQEYPTEEAMLMAKRGHDVFQQIEDFPKPVIAAVNGFCLGGGCELAMAAHIRTCSENAKFGQPEVNLGMIPGYGGTQRLPQLIGKSKAMELLMTGDMITAEEAKSLGLVSYVYALDELIEESKALLLKIIQKAPLAITGIINSVNAQYDETKNGFDQEIKEFGKLFETKDFQEGVDAFLAKRPAQFKGK